LKARILFTVVFIGIFLGACSKTPSPQQFFAKAQSDKDQGNLKSAIISLKNALQAKPDYVEARVLLGEIYLSSGDGESAEKEFVQASKVAGDSSTLQLNVARALLLQEKFNDVVAKDTDVSGMADEHKAEWFRIRAESYLKLNSPKRAEQELAKASAVNKPSRELALTDIKLQVARHDVQSAAETLSNLLNKYPDFAEAWYFSAKLNLQQQDYAAAKQALQKVVDLTDAQLLSRLAVLANLDLIELQINAKEFPQAKQSLERLQKKTSSHHPVVMYFAAYLAYQDKRYDVAKNMLHDVIQKIPDFMPSFLLLGATQYALEEYEGANLNVEKYLSAVPKDIGARRLLAEIQLKQNRPIDALEVLSAVPNQEEKDERFLNMLARATLSSGDTAAATNSLRELVQAHPNDPSLRAELVQALVSGGDFDEAIKQISASKLDAREKVISTVSMRVRQGKVNIARNLIQTELAKNKDATLLTLAGVVELSDNQAEAAQRYFQQAVSVDAGYAPALVYLANAAIKAHEYETAEEQLQQVLKAQPNNWLAMMNMANVAIGLKQSPEQVLLWVERANEVNPAAIAPAKILIQQALRKGEKEKALRLAQALVQASNNNPQALIILSKVQVVLGTANAAIKTLRDLSKQYPKNADPYREIVAIYLKQKNWLDAKSELEHLLALDAKDIKARIALIKVYLALHDINAARAQAAVVKQGQYHPAITLLINGDIEATAGNWKAAVGFYEQALQARENPQTVIKLANAYRQAKQEKAAIALLQKWHDKQSFSLASLILSEYLEKAGDLAAAIKVLEELSAREANNPIVWNNLAWLYLAAKDQKYMQAASKAYEISPKSFRIVDTYGWMLLQSESNKETALSILAEADQMSKDDPSVKYHLAVALHKNSRNAEAKMTLEQALSSQKGFADKAQAEQLMRDL